MVKAGLRITVLVVGFIKKRTKVLSIDSKLLVLWARRKKSTVAFEYCGLVIPIDHQGERPMSVRFRLLSPISSEAMARLQPRQE